MKIHRVYYVESLQTKLYLNAVKLAENFAIIIPPSYHYTSILIYTIFWLSVNR